MGPWAEHNLTPEFALVGNAQSHNHNRSVQMEQRVGWFVRVTGAPV
jgi:hypothetical protein